MGELVRILLRWAQNVPNVCRNAPKKSLVRSRSYTCIYFELTKYLGCGFKVILTDDHQAVSLQSYEAASKNNAVGVIFATHTAEHPMLAVMLNEMQDLQFSDSLGFVQGTSADITSYDGFVNTASLQNTFDEKTGHGSPLADAVFRYHHYGQSDYIPSVSEMRLLVNALPVVNPVIERLHGTPISQSHADCWYWTSTEVDGKFRGFGPLATAKS